MGRCQTRVQSACNALMIAWLRTPGVNTNGAAAKVMDSDRLGNRVRPGTLGLIKVGQREYIPKKSLCQKT